MTLFGKLFVLINTALSLFLGTWAMILLLNRTDWSNNPAKGDKPAGELVERINRVEKGWKDVAAAEGGWKTARSHLLAIENGPPAPNSYGRAANRAWYRAELQHLKTGATPDNPARTIQLDEKSRPVLDDNLTSRPKMVKAFDLAKKDLLSLDAYNKQEKDLFVALETEQKRLIAAIELDSKLTETLLGPLGLHQLILDERAKREGILSELDLAQRPLRNSQIEVRLLLNRQQQLAARVSELKKAQEAQLTGTGPNPER